MSDGRLTALREAVEDSTLHGVSVVVRTNEVGEIDG